jgi:DNA mismatch endonuclease (patch repair protein)
MADVLTPAQRSRCMASNRGKNTRPEIAVQAMVRRLRMRYDIHAVDLPGVPDIVLRRRKKAIQVHGCFWHRHNCRWGMATPATRGEYWHAKFSATLKRDRRSLRQLRANGWSVMVVWECQIREPERLAQRIARFLSG